MVIFLLKCLICSVQLRKMALTFESSKIKRRFRVINLNFCNLFQPHFQLAFSFIQTRLITVQMQRPFFESCATLLGRSCEQPRPMHRPVQFAHSSFIEGSHTTKNTFSGFFLFNHGHHSAQISRGGFFKKLTTS